MNEMLEILNEQKPCHAQAEQGVNQEDGFIESIRSRLAAVVAGGNSKQYLGKYTIEDIEK